MDRTLQRDRKTVSLRTPWQGDGKWSGSKLKEAQLKEVKHGKEKHVGWSRVGWLLQILIQ